MDLSTFIVAVFCLIDSRVEDRRLRVRGPLPKLSDAEVLTIEVVGEFLGMDTDEAIFRYFREHYGEWFPALREVHRTTFARQSANLSGRSRRAFGKSSSSLYSPRSHLRALRLDALAGVLRRTSLPLPALRRGSRFR